MQTLSDQGFLDIGPHRLEYCMIGPRPNQAPTLVVLHEGLGCVGLWGDFPDKLQAATGYGVFVYSRAGYGQSSPVPLPRPVTFMHDEARNVLPKLFDVIGLQRGMLVGHSDGASISAIYVGSVQDHRVRGLVLMAPHFIVEDVSVASIAEIRKNYATTDLRAKLGRWHANVDVAFRGWAETWLDPHFRDWSLQAELAHIRVPILIVQGEDDQYGTVKQIEMAREECYCPVEVELMAKVKHVPHREAPERTLSVVADFCTRILNEHEGSARKLA